jgi:hypothetical protein
MSVVRAMTGAGLPIDVETAYRRLEEIANERGPDDTRRFDTLLERLGLKWNHRVIAGYSSDKSRAHFRLGLPT